LGLVHWVLDDLRFWLG